MIKAPLKGKMPLVSVLPHKAPVPMLGGDPAHGISGNGRIKDTVKPTSTKKVKCCPLEWA